MCERYELQNTERWFLCCIYSRSEVLSWNIMLNLPVFEGWLELIGEFSSTSGEIPMAMSMVVMSDGWSVMKSCMEILLSIIFLIMVSGQVSVVENLWCDFVLEDLMFKYIGYKWWCIRALMTCFV